MNEDERGDQVVGGVLPDQEDAAGNFSQTDPSGGPGWRPTIPGPAPADDPAGERFGVADEPIQGEPPADTAGGGYGTGSGYGSSGGSQSGGDNLATGPATEFMRGGENALDNARAAADEPAGDETGDTETDASA